MKKLYAYLLYAVLGVELVVFAGFFVRGPQGLRNLSDIYIEEAAMQEGLTQLTQEVTAIKQDIDDWNNHPFHREKKRVKNCKWRAKKTKYFTYLKRKTPMFYTLPPLPYAYDALEPHIDARTMEIHHNKHHQAYIDNLNAALAKHPAVAETAAL